MGPVFDASDRRVSRAGAKSASAGVIGLDAKGARVSWRRPSHHAIREATRVSVPRDQLARGVRAGGSAVEAVATSSPRASPWSRKRPQATKRASWDGARCWADLVESLTAPPLPIPNRLETPRLVYVRSGLRIPFDAPHRKERSQDREKIRKPGGLEKRSEKLSGRVEMKTCASRKSRLMTNRCGTLSSSNSVASTIVCGEFEIFPVPRRFDPRSFTRFLRQPVVVASTSSRISFSGKCPPRCSRLAPAFQYSTFLRAPLWFGEVSAFLAESSSVARRNRPRRIVQMG